MIFSMRHTAIAFAVPALLSVVSTRGTAQSLTAATANANSRSVLTTPAPEMSSSASLNVSTTPSTSAEGQKAPAPAVSTVGPTAQAARAGIAPRTSKEMSVSSAAQDRHIGAGQNIAMMIVGGAALVTGLIIGGDGGTIVAIGGAAVGLVGLYNYVK